MQLRIPGPTPIPDEILQAMARQMIDHRGPEFAPLIADVTARLKKLFQTENDLFILTGSGSGGMEAAIVNTLSPGDRVLSLSIGAFGDRFAEMTRAFGADVVKAEYHLGSAVDPDDVRQRLRGDASIKAVLVTHNETSTGVENDLQAISRVVHEDSEALLLVDAISSIGSVNLETDRWGCDVVVTASQKGWMVPPGLAMASFGPRAWEAHPNAKMPRTYWDFGLAKRYLEIGQTPWTPAVSVFFALQVALKMMESEGLESIFARHRRAALRAREGVKSLGLELFADERVASSTVTAVKNPEGVDGKALLRILREDHAVVLSGGQASLVGKIFRIGHLGFVQESDIDEVLAALAQVLPRVGYTSSAG